MKKQQLGFSFWNALAWIILGVSAVIIGAKAFPAYQEYYATKKIIKTMIKEDDLSNKDALKASFDRRATIGYVDTTTSNNLIITIDGGGTTIERSYEKVIPLFGNVSLLFQFDIKETSAGQKAMP